MSLKDSIECLEVLDCGVVDGLGTSMKCLEVLDCGVVDGLGTILSLKDSIVFLGVSLKCSLDVVDWLSDFDGVYTVLDNIIFGSDRLFVELDEDSFEYFGVFDCGVVEGFGMSCVNDLRDFDNTFSRVPLTFELNPCMFLSVNFGTNLCLI